MAVEETFVHELRDAFRERGFTVVGADFDRTQDFPQLLVRFAGFNSIRAATGDRVPLATIRVAIGYRREVMDDLNEQVEDVASDVFDVMQTVQSVLSFSYTGVQVFEPLDGTESEYLGVSFSAERAGGINRGEG